MISYRGSLDEVSLYHRALSPEEIASISAAGAAGKCTNGLPLPPAPTTVRLVSVPAESGSEIVLPLELVARGDENAIGFSLNFDPAVLTLRRVALGEDVPLSATLVTNILQANGGRVGLSISLPVNETFPAGTHELARLHFTVAPVLNSLTTPIAFSDAPTARQVSNTKAQALPHVFADASIEISDVEFEADVAPREGGDGALTVIDWVQLGRFVARLDSIDVGSEYRRADCAPRSSRGNGKLSVTDWVQAGRYAAGLDPITPVGGPSAPDNGELLLPAGTSSRVVQVMDVAIPSGGTARIPVKIEAQGDENALGFSVRFDPAKLRFVRAELGAAVDSAALHVNTHQAGLGRVGVALALPVGSMLRAGSLELAYLEFAGLAGPTGTTVVEFEDEPVHREVSDVAAEPLDAGFADGVVTVTRIGPVLQLSTSGANLVVHWTVEGSESFELESASTPSGSPWQPVAVPPLVISGQKLVILPPDGSQRFFRLRKQ